MAMGGSIPATGVAAIRSTISTRRWGLTIPPPHYLPYTMRFFLGFVESVLWFFLLFPYGLAWAAPVSLLIGIIAIKVLDIDPVDDDQPLVKNKAEAVVIATPFIAGVITSIYCWLLGCSLFYALVTVTFAVFGSLGIVSVVVFCTRAYRKPPESDGYFM